MFETGKKTCPRVDGATLRFSRTGARLGAVMANGTYIWNTQSGSCEARQMLDFHLID